MPGQLDQISEAIGEIRGTVAGIERYIHEERHGVRNLSSKVDGIGALIANAEARINASVNTALERVEARIATIDERVTILERIRERESGARGLVVWFLQSPLVGWIAAAVLLFAAWWKGQLK